ncbi:MAG: aminoacyl-tRNA hydrolase [Kiritimatiellae bacterium]|nr:aminoacyl-tRNA hydrolase [Kiritimatiellia bacterium]
MVVGLGNPGSEYAGTRHNAGFEVVERLARRVGAEWRRSRQAPAECAIAELPEAGRVLFVKPLTYMNASGEAVAALARWHRLRPSEVVVVYDDVDLPLGTVRVRARGSSGGHRGMGSVIEQMGDDGIARVRIGIGRGRGDRDTVAHVLSRFSEEERPVAEAAMERAAAAVETLLTRGIERAMNEFNAEPKETQQP